MGIVRAIMRYFSFAFHGLLALLLLGLAVLAGVGGQHNLKLEMLPWTGEALTWWLLGLALVGLIATILAIRGILRVLFLIWSAAVLVLIVKGYFLSPYLFSPGEFSKVIGLSLCAVLALVGAWFQLRGGQPNKYAKGKAY